MSFANRSDATWPPAPDALQRPQAAEVVVYRTALAAVDATDDSELSAEERARASRFQFDRVRQAFIQGRLFLRRVIGRLLNRPPEMSTFTTEGAGKPRLVGEDLAFNLSHSGGAVVLAVAGAGPVGVDIELVSLNRDLMGLARRYFSPLEFQALERLSETERGAAFYRCWTRKEAFMKALGEGLSHPLDAFSVSLEPDRPAEIIEIRGDADESTAWRVFDLDIGESMMGALVAPSSVLTLRRFTVQSI